MSERQVIFREDGQVVAPTWEQLSSDARRVRQLEAALSDAHERARHACAKLDAVLDAVHGWSWIANSRGPYEWDDDRYREEAGRMLEEIRSAAYDGLRAAQPGLRGSTSSNYTFYWSGFDWEVR